MSLPARWSKRVADRVFAIDPVAYRLSVAEKMGAVPVLPDGDFQDKVNEYTDGVGFDSVMEVVGSPDA
jgi:threonine dehydrogenase-like Zn-dependent dehydrogenase